MSAKTASNQGIFTDSEAKTYRPATLKKLLQWWVVQQRTPNDKIKRKN